MLFDSTSLGTVAVGELVFLAVIWDADNDQFIFFRNGFPPLTYTYAGVVTDTDPPGSTFGKHLDNRVRVENCIPDPEPMGYMDTIVGHVWVNQSGAP